jgi:hypothetical protein
MQQAEAPDEVSSEVLRNKGYVLVDKTIRDARYGVCKICPELRTVVKTCKQCGCFMPAKTWLKNAKCPNYWW